MNIAIPCKSLHNKKHFAHGSNYEASLVITITVLFETKIISEIYLHIENIALVVVLMKSSYNTIPLFVIMA